MPSGATSPEYESASKRVQMSRLEAACYEAGRDWMSSAERQRLLIFAPCRDEAAAPERYGAEVWRVIVVQLQRAEQEVYTRLAKLLKHVFPESRLEALLATVAEELGEEAKNKIQQASIPLPPAAAAWGAAEVERGIQAAFARRRAILGGYAYLERQLDSVSAGSEVDCPVCLDKTAQWSISRCGHLVCSQSAGRWSVRTSGHRCREFDCAQRPGNSGFLCTRLVSGVPLE